MPSRAGNTSQKYCNLLSLCACITLTICSLWHTPSALNNIIHHSKGSVLSVTACHLLMGVKDQSRSADVVGGSPVAQLPTMSTTESGFVPRRAWAAMGLKLPMASTNTLARTATPT